MGNDFQGMDYANYSIDTMQNQADMMNSWNSVFDWVFNVTGKRQLKAQQLLAAEQAEYQRQLMAKSFNYSQQMANYNYNLSRLMQEQQQKYVGENMAKQAMYNQYLSNRGRDIGAMRSNGINPASGSSPISSSVSPGGVPTAQSSQPFAGSPNFTMPGFSLSSPHGNPVSGAAAARNFAEVRKIEAEAKGQEIKNSYGNLREYVEISNLMSSIARNEAEAKKLGTETYRIWNTLKEYKELMRSEIFKNNMSGIESYANSNAVEENADTNRINAETEKQFKELYGKVLQYNARTGRLLYELEKDKNPSVIDEINSRSSKNKSEASYTQQEILWYADKTISALDLNDAKINQLVNEAKESAQRCHLLASETALKDKEVAWFEERILFDQIERAASTILDHIPFNGVRKNIISKVTEKIQGINQRGHKSSRTVETYNYE